MNGHMYMVWLEESGSEVRKRESCQRMIERNEVVRGQKAVKITGALGRMTTSSGRSASGFTLTEELMKRPYVHGIWSSFSRTSADGPNAL